MSEILSFGKLWIIGLMILLSAKIIAPDARFSSLNVEFADQTLTVRSGYSRREIERVSPLEEMVLIGYASDGFPVYSQFGYANANDPKSAFMELKRSYRTKEGNRPAGSPGGKYDGTFVADWEYVPNLGEYSKDIYHYYLTANYPFISRCVMGTPDPSFRKTGPHPNGKPLVEE